MVSIELCVKQIAALRIYPRKSRSRESFGIKSNLCANPVFNYPHNNLYNLNIPNVSVVLVWKIVTKILSFHLSLQTFVTDF